MYGKYFWNFHFLAHFGPQKSKKLGFFQFFRGFEPQNGPKNENFKNSYTTFLDLPPRMLHAKFELPKWIFPKEDRFFRWKLTISVKYFPYISHINSYNFAIPPLTFVAAKLKPLGIERQMSPFWKLEKWGYKIYRNKKDLKNWPWTPPPYTLNNAR